MAFYECVFIIRQDVSSADVDKLTEQFSGILSTNGGKIIKTEYWGLRTLAYKVKKNRKGHYVMLGVEASHEAAQEMMRNLSLHEDVIRNVLIRVHEIDMNQSPVMQASPTKSDFGAAAREDFDDFAAA